MGTSINLSQLFRQNKRMHFKLPTSTYFDPFGRSVMASLLVLAMLVGDASASSFKKPYVKKPKIGRRTLAKASRSLIKRLTPTIRFRNLSDPAACSNCQPVPFPVGQRVRSVIHKDCPDNVERNKSRDLQIGDLGTVVANTIPEFPESDELYIKFDFDSSPTMSPGK